MKGDFTRFTFRPEKQYTSVRLQQGRVQLDADWNEQVDIHAYQMQTAQASFFGENGAPKAMAGFKVGFDATRGLTLSPGRYYVAGLLCELSPSSTHAAIGTTYKDQPFFPGAPLLASLATGSYLIYLDVWTRHVTSLEDPQLREVALSGPDTTTRTQTVWQLRLLKLDQPLAQLDSANLATRLPASTVKMAARARSLAPAAGSALQPPGSGYLRLDNHLYRVEVHQGGRIGQDAITFKCSRDNGAIVVPLLSLADNTAVIGPSPQDEERGFAIGTWVELSDDARELRGEPGVLCRVTSIEGRNLTLQPPTGVTLDFAKLAPNPKVRRWDLVMTDLPTQFAGQWLALEDGLEVQFAGTTCRCGDYWVIPARTATRDIEWPRQGNDPALIAPSGISHSYADLATATWDGTQLKDIIDRRLIFPSLTDLRNVDPSRYDQLLFGHKHTGDGDGSKIPRDGIVDGAINGAKIASDADVKIGKLGVSGNLELMTGSNPIHIASGWNGAWTGETNSGAICSDTGGFKALMLVGNRGGVAGAPRKVGVWDILEVNGTLKTTSDTEVGGSVTVKGTDLRIDNANNRGGRDGTNRRALVHDSNDTLTINRDRDYSSGVKIEGQLTMDGRLVLDENILRLRSSTSPNHGLGYFGANNPFAGTSVEGPVLFGREGGALGTVNVAAAEVAGSVYLTGGGHLTIPAFNEDFSAGITVEAWVRYDSFPNWSRVMDFGGGSGQDNILLANDGTSTTARLNIHNGAAGSATSSVPGSSALATGTWIHICATVDASGNGKFYKNGAQFGSTVTGLALPTNVNRTSNFIGKSNWPSDGGFNGRIANLRIWKRALSANQVGDNFTSSRPLDPEGLVGYWKLDEGSGTVARDSSSRGRHGTLVAGTTNSAFESYQKIALSWDQSRNVECGSNLTIGNYLYVGGRMAVRGSDFVLDNVERRGTNTTGSRIALVHDFGDRLHINYGGEYTGGTLIGGSTVVNGKLKSGNTKTSASTSSGTIWSVATNANYTDIDGMSLSTIWVGACTALVMVTIGGVQIEGSTNTRGYFTLIYQATGASNWTTLGTSVHEWNISGFGLRDIQMHALVTLNGGSYNFKVQARTDTTNSTLRVGYYNSHRVLSVVELT